MKLVQSHYDNLVDDGGEPPVITEGMMTDYFFNIEGMRTVAFGLVSNDRNRIPTKLKQQMEKAFTHARTKKGDAFRKRSEKKRFEEFCLFVFDVEIIDQAHQSGLRFGRVVFGTGRWHIEFK